MKIAGTHIYLFTSIVKTISRETTSHKGQTEEYRHLDI